MRTLAEWASSTCRPWCARCREPILETMESCVGCGLWWDGTEATDVEAVAELSGRTEAADAAATPALERPFTQVH